MGGANLAAMMVLKWGQLRTNTKAYSNGENSDLLLVQQDLFHAFDRIR